MDCGRFGSQVVDHVLPVLAYALLIIQGFAVEDDSWTVWTVRSIVVLRPYASDNPRVADLDAISAFGCKRIRARGYDGNFSKHRGERVSKC